MSLVLYVYDSFFPSLRILTTFANFVSDLKKQHCKNIWNLILFSPIHDGSQFEFQA